MEKNFRDLKCVPCKLGDLPLGQKAIQEHLEEIDEKWEVINNHQLCKSFKFKNFKEALLFTNDIGALAEHEGHHPDIMLRWGEVKVALYTHKINGLSENDFILADKIDATYSARFGTYRS